MYLIWHQFQHMSSPQAYLSILHNKVLPKTFTYYSEPFHLTRNWVTMIIYSAIYYNRETNAEMKLTRKEHSSIYMKITIQNSEFWNVPRLQMYDELISALLARLLILFMYRIYMLLLGQWADPGGLQRIRLHRILENKEVSLDSIRATKKFTYL